MAEVRMPKLGADMTEGRVVEWCKRPGDPVRRGEVIAVVETDKANVEIEAFSDGVFERAVVEPSDTWLPVGTVIAVIGSVGAPSPAVKAPAPVLVGQAPLPWREQRGGEGDIAKPASAPPSPSVPLPPGARDDLTAPPAPVPVPPAAHTTTARTRSSPYARRMARERGIAIGSMTGTGPAGRVIARDVESFAPPPGTVVPARATTPADRRARMRESIAAAMARSKREIPHYYLATTIDMGRAIEWLTATNAARSVSDRLLYGVLLLKATALALREVPDLNGFTIDGKARRSESIHVGTAIAMRGGGLIAPALLDTDRQPLTDLMHALQDLVQRARAGTLRGSEMTEATITVTSLGDRGVESVFGVIYPPQLALVGFGKLVERPWVVDGQVVARPLIQASLAADHRATDGHTGGLFLDALANLLQEPEKL